jgi:hypothetical protein
MRDPAWVNVTPGVPIISDFSSTRGQGTPICIDSSTDEPYYLLNDVVTRLAGSGGGSYIPLVDGAEPPVFITDGAGTLILVPWSP